MFISIIDISELAAEAAALLLAATPTPDVANCEGAAGARSAVRNVWLARGATPLRAGPWLVRGRA
jgi:hypothetical protein